MNGYLLYISDWEAVKKKIVISHTGNRMSASQLTLVAVQSTSEVHLGVGTATLSLGSAGKL